MFRHRNQIEQEETPPASMYDKTLAVCKRIKFIKHTSIGCCRYNMCHSQLLRQPKHNALSGFVLHETEIFAQSLAAKLVSIINECQADKQNNDGIKDVWNFTVVRDKR